MALKLHPVDKGGRLNLGTTYSGQTYQVTEVPAGETYTAEDDVIVLSPVEIVTSRQRSTPAPADAPPLAA